MIEKPPKPPRNGGTPGREEKVAYRRLEAQKTEVATRKKEIREGLPHLYGFPFYAWARNFYESRHQMTLLCAANQISKAVDIAELIPVPGGFSKVANLGVGDKIYAQDGTLTTITAVPFDGEDEMYEFVFDDDSRMTVSSEHLWVAKGYEERFRKTYTDNRPRSSTFGQKTPNPDYGRWKTYSTKDIISRGGYSPATTAPKRFAFPIAEPVAEHRRNPLSPYLVRVLPDPYLVGLLLGDGHFGATVTLTNPEPSIQKYVLAHGAIKINTSDKAKCPSYSLSFFVDDARSLGLAGTRSATKFIPRDYLHASIEQRKALLAGLMDTDGCATTIGVYSYTTVSPQLAQDVRELIASLGGKSRATWRKSSYTKNGERFEAQDACTIYVLTPFNPFRLPRKAERWHPIRYAHERVLREVHAVGKRRCRCFTVAHESGTFLATRDYLVTHNSSTQIRKCIDWATNLRKQTSLWKRPPRIFWYLYPSKDVATVEFEKKWEPEFLPRGTFKEHPVYGWRVQYDREKKIHAIHFNTGVSIYFKTYKQDASDLQSGTCDAIFCDEELPVELYDELQARLLATDGYFHMVFTATLNQDTWRRAIEGQKEDELFPEAMKIQVSMYDCLAYEDGSETPWSLEKIERAKRRCKNATEVQRRIYGKFVTEEGRKYGAFDPARHWLRSFDLRADWRVYSAVDGGSGGETGHPAAIVFVAVAPDCRSGVVFRGWRGDGILTTAGDIFERYLELRREAPATRPVLQAFDHAAKDFGTIAMRAGESFIKAEKNHAIGEDVVDTLFKNDMLHILETDELKKLGTELLTVMRSTPKTKAKDDFADALRYCVVHIPWDWTALANLPTEAEAEAEAVAAAARPLTEAEKMAEEINERRGIYGKRQDQEGAWGELEDQIAEWNDAMGT